MPTISIAVRQRRAKSPTDHIVCGNNDYAAVFDLDEEWDAYDVKTARFIWNGQYSDVVFSGDTCAIPQINNASVCAVGVFAGDLHTTTPAFIKCEKSILCGTASPAAPSQDVYAQIMEILNNIFGRIEALEQGGGESDNVADYTGAVLGVATLGKMILGKE